MLRVDGFKQVTQWRLHYSGMWGWLLRIWMDYHGRGVGCHGYGVGCHGCGFGCYGCGIGYYGLGVVCHRGREVAMDLGLVAKDVDVVTMGYGLVATDEVDLLFGL